VDVTLLKRSREIPSKWLVPSGVKALGRQTASSSAGRQAGRVLGRAGIALFSGRIAGIGAYDFP
jgi:hypothetical protein